MDGKYFKIMYDNNKMGGWKLYYKRQLGDELYPKYP